MITDGQTSPLGPGEPAPDFSLPAAHGEGMTRPAGAVARVPPLGKQT